MKKIFTLYLLFKSTLLWSLSISVSGSPSIMIINSAIAGQQPTADTDTSTTWNIDTDSNYQKVVGNINSSMPSSVTLQISLAAPSGAVSAGLVSMSTTAKSLVTSIDPNTWKTGLLITYQLSATVNASKVTNSTRTVTYTIQ